MKIRKTTIVVHDNFLDPPEEVVVDVLAPRGQRPDIVCLCGSTRFKKEYIKANFQETMAGKIVLSVGLYSHADAEVYTLTEAEKAALDELHLRKIDLADEILVINPRVPCCYQCGKPVRALTEMLCPHCKRFPAAWLQAYVGESTRREIAYAQAHGKPVRYLEEVSQLGQGEK